MVSIASTNCCFLGFLGSMKLGKKKTISLDNVDKVISELQIG